MVWVPNWTFNERLRQFEPTGDYNVCFRYAAYKVMEEELIPAFTVADLLEILPADITYGRLRITRSSYSKGEDWRIFYKRVGTSKGSIISFGDRTLVAPACNMIEWVVTKGYKLNV